MNEDANISKNSKTLNRAIHNVPNFRKENGELSSAFFADSLGVSVDFDNKRTKKEIYDSFCERFTYTVTGIGVLKISEVETIESILIKPAPDENNKNHAMIIRKEGKLELTKGQRRQLAKICTEYLGSDLV